MLHVIKIHHKIILAIAIVVASLLSVDDCCAIEKIIFSESFDDHPYEKWSGIPDVEPPYPVPIDIKPGSCPNPLNTKEQGVLPVAILGSEIFDVTAIDVASIRFAGVAPIRSSLEDVASPILDDVENCSCTTDGPDGFLDLTLKFNSKDIIAKLGNVIDGEEIVLTLTGLTIDGVDIVGNDCITIIKKTIKEKPPSIEMEFVSIDELKFSGEMSVYETTNAQYCQFLNSSFADGSVVVNNNKVFSASDTDFSEPYFELYAHTSYSQITFTNNTFSVRNRDGYSMAEHPVVMVTWYGGKAFCDYYGFRLPTTSEWRAVADYDGTYIYGCGTTVDHSLANYQAHNPLNLSSYPYTTPVGYYGEFGYGLCDMCGNANEMMSQLDNQIATVHGGSWSPGSTPDRIDINDQDFFMAYNTTADLGFRVCR